MNKIQHMIYNMAEVNVSRTVNERDSKIAGLMIFMRYKTRIERNKTRHTRDKEHLVRYKTRCENVLLAVLHKYISSG